jgi:hypothetical protein
VIFSPFRSLLVFGVFVDGFGQSPLSTGIISSSESSDESGFTGGFKVGEKGPASALSTFSN